MRRPIGISALLPGACVALFVSCGSKNGEGPITIGVDIATTSEQAVALVRRYADAGFPQIKIYSSLKPELVAPLAAHAHDKGLRVSGHVPSGMDALSAVKAGYDEIQHANFLFLQFLATKDDDTRTPLRFTRVAEKAA